jgi:hypothetical protein
MLKRLALRPKVAGLITFAALAAAAVFLLGAGSALGDTVSGAVFTTDFACGQVDGNVYATKDAVYVDGGPAKSGAAGLPDSTTVGVPDYYVQVTTPSGTVLGKSVVPMVEVEGGNFVECYQLSAILKTATSGYTSAGYDNTTNNGGEYKVWVSKDPTFADANSKTDNFKVAANCTVDCIPAQAAVSVEKWYDANGNGIDDDPSLITGWKVNISGGPGGGPGDAITPYTGTVEAGYTYTVSEYTPNETNWVHSTATSFTQVISDAGADFQFGNYCRFAGVGARTIGYWKTHQTATTVLLPVTLGNQDGVTAWTLVVKTWTAAYSILNGASSSDANVMLKAQLLGAMLNVKADPTFGTAYIAATTQTVNDVIAAANTFLAANGSLTLVKGSTLRTQAIALEQQLDGINNSNEGSTGSFVINPTPCSFTFP